MAATTYTVKKGDTLWSIAEANNTTVDKLVELNDITDPDYIVVGQVIKLSGDSTKSSNNSNKAKIKAFGLQSNTDRTVYATWTWTKSNTDSYTVMWYYATGDGFWYVANDGGSTVKSKQATYNAPSNATKVKFKVKPIAKKRKVSGKETAYWTAEWSTEKTYSFKDNPPTTPDVPDVKLENLKLTATLDNLDVNGTHIQFQIVRDNEKTYKTVKVEITKAHASYSCSVASGSEYKVRCRAVRGDEYSDWTDYSSNYAAAPSAPAKIVSIKALSETSVYIDWENVSTADTYEVQYTTQKRYFDSSNEVSSMTVDAKVAGHAEITGLQSGEQYFFRVRAVKGENKSKWSEIVSIKIGEKPAAPTTWSSTTTAIADETVTLYWVHNSVDGSSQTYAEIAVYDGNTYDGEDDEDDVEIITVKNSTDEDEKDKTSSYVLESRHFSNNTKIYWKVRTRGITEEYSDWSVLRTIEVYEKPSLNLEVTDASGNAITTLTSFPFYISMAAEPLDQTPLSYYVSIIPDSTYETVDEVGNPVIVNEGEAVYSRHFDVSDQTLLLTFSAGDVNLENNVVYNIHCSVAMNSGLSGENDDYFKVGWTDMEYAPNAEIGIDEESWSAVIRPYCEDENETPIENITLSVYRRDFDGGFTLIEPDIPNGNDIFITDPHPALDYARYRIVARDESTGAISYSDIPGYPTGCKAAIIQWDEQWSAFDTTNEEAMEQPNWSGSMLILPYNIDISDSNAPDVSLIEYIGREHPVGYYGTHKGHASTWNMVIPHDDSETLYGIRRLQNYMGDVYVREPSGSGYWANVKVSYSKKHKEVTIPITLSITRVEGGI